MALYHLTLKHTVKSDCSASTAAAYRHCCKIGDADFSKKKGFIDSMLMLPENAPDFLQNDPQLFWALIDEVEKKKNARVFSELIVSLHHDLTLEQNKELVKGFVQDLIVSRGMAADVCIHNPGDNLHAHIQFSYRSFKNEADRKSVLDIFGNKIREEKTEGKHWTNSGELENFRQKWEEYSNKMLIKANGENAELISHKTLKAQRQEALEKGDLYKAAELDREPVKHIYRRDFEAEKAINEAKAERIHNANMEKVMLHKEFFVAGKLDTPEAQSLRLKRVPVFAETFEEKLKEISETRIKVIQRNVKEYIENRTQQLARFTNQITARASKLIHTTRTVARNKLNEGIRRIVASRSSESNSIFRENPYLRKLESLVDKKLERSEEPALDQKPEQVRELHSEAYQVKVEKAIDKKVDKKPSSLSSSVTLWQHPFLISTPTYKPSWITKLGDGTGTSSSS